MMRERKNPTGGAKAVSENTNHIPVSAYSKVSKIKEGYG
jgi:hypothetical protein